MNIYGPAWVEVELEAIRRNVQSCQNYINTKLLAVVKADGYGHGAVMIAKVMEEEKVDYLGVATIFEGLELRKHGIKMPILVFQDTPLQFIDQGVLNDLTLTVSSIECARHIEFIGQKLSKLPKIHVKLETGMTRLGFSCTCVDHIESVCKMKLNVEGLYTHFAMADSLDFEHTDEQAKKYMAVVDQLNDRGITFNIKHVSNSAAMMRTSDYHFDMVRAGGILYGHFCLGHFVDTPPFEVERAMSIRSVLSHINDVKAETGVSYGWLYKTEKPASIGVLPIGYTDGISRRNTNKTSFLLRGQRVKQVGLICMDQLMIDVTDIRCEVGDVVTLLGCDGDEITLNERAGDAGIGKCELFAGIGRRLPKVYFKNGNYFKTINYLLDV